MSLFHFCYPFLPADRTALPVTPSSTAGTLCSWPGLLWLLCIAPSSLLHALVLSLHVLFFSFSLEEVKVFFGLDSNTCLEHVPGVVAANVLPEVRKQAGKVISDVET